jgi:hypothetical protein
METASIWVNPLDIQEGRLAADVLSVPWLPARFGKCPGETTRRSQIRSRPRQMLKTLQERGRHARPDEWIWRTFMETKRVQNLLIYADFDGQRCSYGNGPQ